MTVDLIRLDSSTAISRLSDLRDCYRETYHFEPDESDDVAEFLPVHAERPGFACVVAEGGRLVGFAYGFTGKVGQKWRDDMAMVLGPELSAM